MKSFEDSRILVTGATGFVGGHMLAKLLELGAKPVVLVRESSDRSKVESFRAAGAEVVFGDLVDPEACHRACAGCEYVFHIAALYRAAKFPDSVYFQVNLEGTRNILDASERAGVKRVVHTSTIGVHSHIEHPPANESEPYHPTDVYQESKVEAEKLALERFRSGTLSGAVIRPAMIWGEGDARILKMFRGIARRRFPMIGSGEIWTHWVYVHDLVHAMLLAAAHTESSGEVYLIAGATPKTLNETVAAIAKQAGVGPLPFKIPAWPIQFIGSVVEACCKPFGIEPPLHRRRADFFIKNRWFDTSKAESQLGYRPAQDFETEVRNIYSWYHANNWL